MDGKKLSGLVMQTMTVPNCLALEAKARDADAKCNTGTADSLLEVAAVPKVVNKAGCLPALPAETSRSADTWSCSAWGSAARLAECP